jgi:hypothetical protein
VPYLRIIPQLIRCLDFTPFEEGKGLGERRGSLDERHRERVRSVDQLVEEWEGTGPVPAPGMGKDWGQLSKVPSKEGRFYQIKQEGEWWQKSQSPERFEDEYNELEAAFIERPTPGGYQGGSAPEQSKSPSVRRTCRDDFELESSSDERDRAYMHDFQIRDSDIRAGYAFPRGTGLPHNGVSANQREHEAHDNRGDKNGPGIRTVVPTHREHYWQERGIVISLRRPPGWSREHHDPLMRERRGRTNIPPEGNMNPLKASTGERRTTGRGKQDNPAQEGGP